MMSAPKGGFFQSAARQHEAAGGSKKHSGAQGLLFRFILVLVSAEKSGEVFDDEPVELGP